jgi:hypothetical protein
MKLLLKCDTPVGTFFIGQSQDGRFHPIFNDEGLGSYQHAWQATEDLANDATFSVLHPETGELLDTSTLGIPESPGEWDRCP